MSYYSWQGRGRITLSSRYQITVCNHSHFQFADLLSRRARAVYWPKLKLRENEPSSTQILPKNELIMMLLLSRVCRIVLFSHNITTVITITLPRKTGGLLTKDDVDFARRGLFWLVTSLQQPGGSTQSAAVHFNCENLHKKCNLPRIHMLGMIMSSRGGGDQTLGLWHNPCNFLSFLAF